MNQHYLTKYQSIAYLKNYFIRMVLKQCLFYKMQFL